VIDCVRAVCLYAAEAAGAGVHHGAPPTQPSKKRARAPHDTSDPLKTFAYNATKLSGGAGDKVRPPVLSVTAAGKSAAGRRQWQQKHKRGEWNPKNKPKKSNFE
jgi:hypothetical protein